MKVDDLIRALYCFQLQFEPERSGGAKKQFFPRRHKGGQRISEVKEYCRDIFEF
jgi:hypothetical protein